ncbi:hypothetical protein TWF281_004696 [Arthrobotrys megalospora]
MDTETSQQLSTSGLLSLPPAILEHIVELCPTSTIKRIRLTCSALKAIATPILFRKFILPTTFFTPSESQIELASESQLLPSKSRIEALQSVGLDHEDASLQVLFENIEELVLQRLPPSKESFDESTDQWPQYSEQSIKSIEAFIFKIKNLKGLDWNIPLSSIPIDLSSLTTLKSLSISYNHTPTSPTSPLPTFPFTTLTSLNFLLYDPTHLTYITTLPNLQILTFSSTTSLTITDFLTAQTTPPPLTSLTLKNHLPTLPYTSLPPIYLQNLTFLTLTPPSTPQYPQPKKSKLKSLLTSSLVPTSLQPPPAETIYDHLRRNSIYPKYIRTFSQSPNLLFFLRSYTSPSPDTIVELEIVLRPYVSKHAERILEFVDNFWEWAISFHYGTLKRLAMYPSSTSSSTQKELDKTRKIHKRLLKSSLFEIHLETKHALRKLQTVETLEMGGLEKEGFYELVEFVLLEMTKCKLRKLIWHFDAIDSMHEKVDEKVVKDVKRFVKEMRWKRHSVNEDVGGRISVTVIPVGEMKFVRDGEYWKLVTVS